MARMSIDTNELRVPKMQRAAVSAPAEGDPYRDLLERARGGCERSRNQLVGLLYPEIRARAGRIIRSRAAGHSLQATDLANEVCVKVLASSHRISWLDHAHALAVACTAMRHVLLDYAKKKNRRKRSHGQRMPLEGVLIAYEDRGIDIVALNEALERFQHVDPEMVRAFEMRMFGGLPLEDIGRVLGLSPRTFSRRWNAAQRIFDAEMNEPER